MRIFALEEYVCADNNEKKAAKLGWKLFFMKIESLKPTDKNLKSSYRRKDIIEKYLLIC